MRHRRNEGTKVWHNPELAGTARRRPLEAASSANDAAADRRDENRHRAALEALFAPRKPAEAASDGSPRSRAKDGADAKDAKPSARIVLATPPESDPAAALRQRLLAKLLASESRPSVSKATTEFLKAGFSFPDDQDVHLKLLEHADESIVCTAIEALAALLADELPKRRTVLESRLRRIEQFAEEGPTRKKAEELRRFVSGRPSPA